MVNVTNYTTTQIVAFSTTTLVAIQTMTIQSLQTWQVQAFTTTQVSALTTTQCAALSNESNVFIQSVGNTAQQPTLTTTQITALGQASFYPPSVAVCANTPIRLTQSVTTALTGLGTSLANMVFMGVAPLTGGQIIDIHALFPQTSTQTLVVVAEQDLSGKISILTSAMAPAQTAGTTTAIAQLSLPNPSNNSPYSTSNFGNAKPGAAYWAGLGSTQSGGVQVDINIAAFE